MGNSTLNAIQTIVDNAIAKAGFNKTRTGIVLSRNVNNTYNIKMDNIEYKNVQCSSGNILSVGDIVKVHIPNNQPSQMYIENSKNGLDSTLIYIASSAGTTFYNEPISTTLTVKIQYGDRVITSVAEMHDAYGDTSELRWYNEGGSQISVENPFTRTISTTANRVHDIAKLFVDSEERAEQDIILGRINSGSSGRGIVSSITKWQKSTNGSSVPQGEWYDYPQTPTDTEYVWTQTTYTYTDGSESVVYAVAGKTGFSPIATVTKPTGSSTATISITDLTGTTTVDVADGEAGADGQTVKIFKSPYSATIGEIQAWASQSSSTWTMDEQPKHADGTLLSVGESFYATVDCTSDGCTYAVGLVVRAAYTGYSVPTKNAFGYFKVAEKGEQGIQGVSLTSVTRYYKLSDTTPTDYPPSANWLTSEPAYTSGDTRNLYICDLFAWSNGTSTHSEISLSSSYEAAKQAFNTAQGALIAANGKNTIFHQTTQPTGGTYKVGDTWFDTDDGYKMYTYNGTTWVAEQLGANAIADLAITNAKIADATIQSAKIAAIDAGKITTGTIDANRINASSLRIGGSPLATETQLADKEDSWTKSIYVGSAGNPRPVKFCSIDYSNCTSETGVLIKMSAVSGHGNGVSYTFLEDIFIGVNYTGTVTIDVLKNYDSPCGSYDGATRAYGDVFYTEDTTNKIVDVFILAGQYSTVRFTPFKRLNNSNGGTITQLTSLSLYSSGTKTYANNNLYANSAEVEQASKTATNYLYFDNGLYVTDNTQTKANAIKIGSGSIDVIKGGQPVAKYFQGLTVWSDDGTEIVHLGYDYAEDGTGTSNKYPYFDLGVRKADTTKGAYSVAEGSGTTASGSCSHAEGSGTTASGSFSHAEGHKTTASEAWSHAEGYKTTASGFESHAEGSNTTASGMDSHAEGYATIASGDYSHAEGDITIASGNYSHAEGYKTTANGDSSHAEGFVTIASGSFSHAQGKFNVDNSNHTDIVGNGTSDRNRSNAYALDWDGNGYFAGDVYVGCNADSSEGNKLPLPYWGNVYCTHEVNVATSSNYFPLCNNGAQSSEGYSHEEVGFIHGRASTTVYDGRSGWNTYFQIPEGVSVVEVSTMTVINHSDSAVRRYVASVCISKDLTAVPAFSTPLGGVVTTTTNTYYYITGSRILRVEAGDYIFLRGYKGTASSSQSIYGCNFTIKAIG